MKLYIAFCHDRHIDPVVRVFSTLEAANTYAKTFMHAHMAHSDGIVEEIDDDGMYCAQYQYEDDHAYVMEATLNDTSDPTSHQRRGCSGE